MLVTLYHAYIIAWQIDPVAMDTELSWMVTGPSCDVSGQNRRVSAILNRQGYVGECR